MFRAGYIIYGNVSIEETAYILLQWIHHFASEEELENLVQRHQQAVQRVLEGKKLSSRQTDEVLSSMLALMTEIAPPFLVFRKKGDGIGFFPHRDAYHLQNEIPENREKGEFTAKFQNGEPVEVYYKGEVLWSMYDAALSAAGGKQCSPSNT